MQTDQRPLAEPSDDARASRRSFLTKAAAGGVLLTAGSLVSPIGQMLPAMAQAMSDDDELKTFLASIELAAVEAYRVAGETGLLTNAAKEIGATYLQHHQAHADKLNETLVEAPVTEPNPALLDEAQSAVEGAADAPALLEVLYQLEEAFASTYLVAVGEYVDARNAAVAATILPVASQHATVLAAVLEKPVADYLVDFLSPDAALEPADYPAAQSESESDEETSE